MVMTIGELSRRTGLSPAVLRMWESRYGFPRPRRLASGHRRYSEADVELVNRILQRRDAGLRLDVAVAEARGSRSPGAPSVFAEVRAEHAHLVTHRLHKATLIGLSWAIEDETAARAERPLLFGAFQREQFYRPSRPRWRELAKLSRATMVFAEFGHDEPTEQEGLVEVPLGEADPMQREWALAVDCLELPAMLTAWELPGQGAVPDRKRIFECIWSVEPEVVRTASRVLAGMAHTLGAPGGADVFDDLMESPPEATPDPRTTSALFNLSLIHI